MTSLEIRNKFIGGTKLAFERLLDQKRREIGYIVISDKDEKVIKVKWKGFKRE